MNSFQRLAAVALLAFAGLGLAQTPALPAPDAGGVTAAAAGAARPDRTLEPSLCCIRPGPAPDTTRKDFLPLKHTDVTGAISGMIAQVQVKQVFENPLEQDRLEAIYVFPLPDNAAVHALRITIKDRTIVGEVKTTEAARETYNEAREKGQTAALVEQSRPNIFTASVANIPPKETVTVEVTYFQTLNYDDGRYSFHFPMVVAPRYLGADQPAPVPGPQPPVVAQNQTVTGPAPDGAQPPPAVVDEETEVLPAQKRTQPAGWLNPADKRIGNISLKFTIDAGVGITAIKSPTHQITTVQTGNTSATVELTKQDEIPNKDFILEYKIAGNALQAAILAHKAPGADTGYFLLMLVPKDEYDSEEILPKEMIYIVDHSGSMRGDKMTQAKLALKSSLHALNPHDTFTIVPFDDRIDLFSDKPVAFTQDNLDKADAFAAGIDARGGTEILKPMQWALSQPADAERLKIVAFLTDGEVNNDEQVVAEVQKTAGAARVYTFGIGHGVNRWMLRKMAEYGHGGFETILPGDDLEDKIARFNDRTSYPVLRDVKADFGGLDAKNLYPATLPDLFTSQPIVLLGTYQKAGKYKVTVGGKNVNGDYSTTLNIDLPETSAANPGLPIVWARARVEDLNDRLIKAQDPKPIVDEIRDLGLKFSLATDYTSFVVVEKTTVQKDGKLETVDVPVPMPAGWEMDQINEEADMQNLHKKADTKGAPKPSVAPGGYGRGGVGGGGTGLAPMAPPPPPMAGRPSPAPANSQPALNGQLGGQGQPPAATAAAPAGADAGSAQPRYDMKLDDQAKNADRELARRDTEQQVEGLQKQLAELRTRKTLASDKAAAKAGEGAVEKALPGDPAATDAFLGDQQILDDQAAILADVLRALAREQAVDGLWKEPGHEIDFATLERSAIAVLSYHRAGETTRRGKFKAQLERAIEGLIKAQKADGTFLSADQGGIRLQAELALTLCEVYGSRNRDSYKTAAENAIAALVKHQRADGMFPATAGGDGDQATTAFAQQCLRRAIALHLGDYDAAAAAAEKALPARGDQLLKNLAHAAIKADGDNISNLDRIAGMAFYLTYGE